MMILNRSKKYFLRKNKALSKIASRTVFKGFQSSKRGYILICTWMMITFSYSMRFQKATEVHYKEGSVLYNYCITIVFM